ncbi:MAG: hypothetical protein FWD80_07565, partial [Propionibacteriaceae bacterium]|nr:hypothetical protein [Propionibacteriaceae bacterium]
MVTSLTASARGHWLVSTYAVVHGVGEFLTALTLFSLFTIGHATGGEIVIYSVLAFGCPSLIALLAYGRRLGKQTEGRIGLTGTVLMAAGILAAPLSWAAVVLLGVGSATFHIAAGTATLKMPNRGTAVGVFESTGAVGLALGGVLGADVWHTMAVSYWSYVAAAVLIVGGFVVLIWGTAHELPGLSAELPADNNVHAPQPSQKPSFTGLVGWMTGNNAVLPTTKSWTLPAGVGRAPFVALSALTIISITRAVTGFAAPQPWKDTTTMVLVASILVAVGRAVGGVAA